MAISYRGGEQGQIPPAPSRLTILTGCMTTVVRGGQPTEPSPEFLGIDDGRSVRLIRYGNITTSAAQYVRVSTSDRGQTVEYQLQPLQEAAGRLLRWRIVAVIRDEGASGTRGHDKRPGLDVLLKGPMAAFVTVSASPASAECDRLDVGQSERLVAGIADLEQALAT